MDKKTKPVDFSKIVFEDWMVHPSEKHIDLYVSGMLEGDVLSSVESHIKTCPECQKEVEWLTMPCPPLAFGEDVDPETHERIDKFMLQYRGSRIRVVVDANHS